MTFEHKRILVLAVCLLTLLFVSCQKITKEDHEPISNKAINTIEDLETTHNTDVNVWLPILVDYLLDDETPNNTPVGTADSYSISEGEQLQISTAAGVLANDTDEDNDPLQVKLETAPQDGTLNLQANGSFSYQHNHNENPIDSFSYSLSDGKSQTTVTVSLNITPVDDVPSIEKMELAQTHVVKPEGTTWEIESLAGRELHLVGNREALAIVDIKSANNRIVEPILEASLNGVKLGEVALNTPETLPPTESDGPAYSDTGYWAVLDEAWVRAGLELTLRANEGQTSAPKAINVGAPTAFTMYTLPFYLFGLDTNDISLTQTAAPDQITKDEYYAKHPIAELNMINHPAQKIQWPYIVVSPRQGRPAQRVTYKEQQGDGYAVMSAVLNTLGAIRNANADSSTSNQYYGPLLMANQAGNYSGPGGGLGGGNLGTGDYSYQGIFIHEAGHAFGMPHANDGYDGGSYPYIGGSLKGSAWGYDQSQNQFLGTFVPSSASRYNNCINNSFPKGRQIDALGRCIKQDPMQSGSGDQAQGDKYTMFSDFNASVVQRYLEGSTSLNSDGSHKYNGGKVFLDSTVGENSATGYSRWDSIDKVFVDINTQTTSGGLWGLDQNLPTQRDVDVHTLIVSMSFAETEGVTQIYPPLSYRGNLKRTIDPTIESERTSIIPNTSENYWYCRGTGCDYTLRVTFEDNSVQHIALQGSFRKWFNDERNANTLDPTSGNSYRVWSVNVDGTKVLNKIELLDTPQLWEGLPTNPTVITDLSF